VIFCYCSSAVCHKIFVCSDELFTVVVDIVAAGEKFVVWNQLDAGSFCELGKYFFTVLPLPSCIQVNAYVGW